MNGCDANSISCFFSANCSCCNWYDYNKHNYMDHKEIVWKLIKSKEENMEYIFGPCWAFVVCGLCLLIGGGCAGALITLILGDRKNGK